MYNFMIAVRIVLTAFLIVMVALGHTWALVATLILITIALELTGWRLREQKRYRMRPKEPTRDSR